MARLEVVTGPMFAGKSKELLRRLERAAHANRGILLIRPSTDNRDTRNIFDFAETDKKLKDYERLFIRTLNHAKELRAMVNSVKPDILAIDEGQFFDKEDGQGILEFIEELLEKMKSKNFTIIVAGLDMDYRHRPFGIMPQLMAMADEVLKLTAICFVCRDEYGPAIFTQRKGGSGKQVEVGDIGLYEARCRACYTIPQNGSA